MPITGTAAYYEGLWGWQVDDSALQTSSVDRRLGSGLPLLSQIPATRIHPEALQRHLLVDQASLRSDLA